MPRTDASGHGRENPSWTRIPALRPGSPFSAAAVVGDVLCLSGQIGANAQGTLVEGVEDQTRQTLANISEVLNLAGANLDDVFKCTVMLADMADWSAFNRIYLEHFHPDRLPTRSSFGVSGLAAGALVEIECWAMLRRPGDGV